MTWILFLISFRRHVGSLTVAQWNAVVCGLTGAVVCVCAGWFVAQTSPWSLFLMLQLLCPQSDNKPFEIRRVFPCVDRTFNCYACLFLLRKAMYREWGFTSVAFGCSRAFLWWWVYIQTFDFLIGMQYTDEIWVPSLRTASLYGAAINHYPQGTFFGVCFLSLFSDLISYSEFCILIENGPVLPCTMLKVLLCRMRIILRGKARIKTNSGVVMQKYYKSTNAVLSSFIVL